MVFIFNKISNKVDKHTKQIKKVVLRVKPSKVDKINLLLGCNITDNTKKIKKTFDYWDNMMDYDNSHGEQYPYIEIIFFTTEDIDEFNRLLEKYNINITHRKATQSIYIPKKWETFDKDKWETTKKIKPYYSINILSYNRYQDERRLTVKALEEMKIKYNIFVEPDEFEEYKKVCSGNVIKLPDNYHNYGQGGVPARNFIKWYSTNILNETKHWILDDNIEGFYRFHMNRRIKILGGCIFRSVEQFCLRYINIGVAGFNYFCMMPEITQNKPPINFNRKAYSCLLITNNLDNWEGIYNEDIDICLRLLKKGYVNLEFQHILINKMESGTIKGGNTNTIYEDNTQTNKEDVKQMGYKKKVDYLINKHPDIKIQYKELKGKKYHHNVDYSSFENNQLVVNPEKYEEVQFEFL